MYGTLELVTVSYVAGPGDGVRQTPKSSVRRVPEVTSYLEQFKGCAEGCSLKIGRLMLRSPIFLLERSR